MTGQSNGNHACVFPRQRDVERPAIAAAGATARGAGRFLDGPPSGMRARLARASRSRSPSPHGARSPRRPASRHIILFLAANPSDSTHLALNAECAAIEHELRMTLGRDDFEFRSKWAVNIDDMMRHLNECQPTIVHFSGHGRAGIQLQDECQCVNAHALAQMIASAAPSTRVVVLNACFSDVVAESLRNLVDCVVGMNGAISDDAARSFAVGFYRALGNWRSVGNAIAQAIATLAAKRLPDEHIPVCRTRDGVNADQLFLPDSR